VKCPLFLVPFFSLRPHRLPSHFYLLLVLRFVFCVFVLFFFAHYFFCDCLLPPPPTHSARRTTRADKSFMEQLQDDFNHGEPYDMSLYQHHLQMLASMGFTSDQGMEALVITGNRGIEAALELLFQNDASIKAKRREESKQKQRRFVPQVSIQSGNGADGSSGMRLQQESVSRRRVEAELKAERAAMRLNLYAAFVRGITAGESISLNAFEQLKEYRKQRNITDAEHAKALDSIGMKTTQFDGLKRFEMKEKADNECVVCLDNVKDHVMFDCMHLCVCEDCAVDFNRPGSKCPMCSKKVRQVARIYM
jgi:Zinc finger, C3HC4 type (RING finger)/UBA-like domain